MIIITYCFETSAAMQVPIPDTSQNRGVVTIFFNDQKMLYEEIDIRFEKKILFTRNPKLVEFTIRLAAINALGAPIDADAELKIPVTYQETFPVIWSRKDEEEEYGLAVSLRLLGVSHG